MHDQHIIWDDRDWRDILRMRKEAERRAGHALTQREFVLWAARAATQGG